MISWFRDRAALECTMHINRATESTPGVSHAKVKMFVSLKLILCYANIKVILNTFFMNSMAAMA